MHKSLSQYKVVCLLDLSNVASKPIQIIECTLNFTSRMDHVKQLQLETSIFFIMLERRDSNISLVDSVEKN
jgi:hypothetical protein